MLELLKPIMDGDKLVKVMIDETFANKHGGTLENIYYKHQFQASLVDELTDIARDKLGVDFETDGSELYSIYPQGANLVFVLKVKSNIIQLENDYIEEETIISSWQSLLETDEDKVFLGLMTVDERRKEIERLKTDREYMRQFLIDMDIL